MSPTSAHLPIMIVVAKAPVAGQAKTRLCPPLTPASAAAVAAAALGDTVRTVGAIPGVRRILALAGSPADLGTLDVGAFDVIGQRGETFGEKLTHAFADAQTRDDGGPTVLVGMDTPQLTSRHITDAIIALSRHDAVIGRAADGGWWLLGLNQPSLAGVLMDVPMSSDETYARTRTALADKGLDLHDLPVLRDVDTIADAIEVAALIPDTAYSAAVGRALEEAQR